MLVVPFRRWQLAGKLADVLSVLVRVSELPVPVEAPEPSGIKRPLEADDSTEGSPVRPDGSHANAELPGEGGTTSGRPGGASATRSRSRRQGRRSANTSSASLRVPGQPLPLHTTELVSAFQGSAASSDTHDSPAAATEGMSNEHDVYSPPGGMTPAAASALHSWHDAQMQQMQEAMKQQTQQQQQHQRQQCQQGPNAEVQAPFGQFFAPVTSTMQPSAAFFAGNSNGLGVGLGGVSAGLGGMFGAPLGAPGQQNVMQSRNFAQGLQPQQGQGQQQQQQGFDESFFSDAAVLTPSASNMGGGGRNGNSSMPRAPNGNGTGEAGLDGGQGRMGGNGVDGPDAFNALWSSQHLWELDGTSRLLFFRLARLIGCLYVCALDI